ncbi:hypothetical protein PV797_20485 [Clostridiaceae bacterium M8S5]|nr:hypothetical protein PV797_20485 [Clostridiaceae bacterium M8S5]
MLKRILMGVSLLAVLAMGTASYAKPEMDSVQPKIGEAVKMENQKLIESIAITSPEDNLVTSEKKILVSGKAKEGLKVLIEVYKVDSKKDIKDFLQIENNDQANKTDKKEDVKNTAKEVKPAVNKTENKETNSQANQVDKVKILDANNKELDIDKLENKDEILKDIDKATRLIAKEIQVKELGIFTEEINVETGNIKIIIFIRDSKGNVLKAVLKNIIIADEEKAKEYIEKIKTNNINVEKPKSENSNQ